MRLTLLLTLLLSGSVTAASPSSNQTKDLDAAKVIFVKMVIANGLKDPDSAKFRRVKVKWDTVCGEVNAKNSFGGYVGYRRFYSIDGKDLHMEESNFREEQWERFCSPNARKPEPPAPYHEQWIE